MELDKYIELIENIENNIKNINELHDKINKKTNEVTQKIEMFQKKKNIQADDSTRFLIFQNKILHNELVYLNNHRQVINYSLNAMLYGSTESVTLMALTVISAFKDITTTDNKLVKASSKKDDNTKLIADIIYNLKLINNILEEIKKYNDDLNNTIKTNNLHCNTLFNNIDFTCSHIKLEYNKHINDIDKTLDYFINYTNKIIEQNENMVVLKFVS
jgi:hypothetical protein